MKKKIITYITILGALTLVSCDDFLDKNPDNRVTLSTPEQMSLALVNGYSEGNIALMCELSSDNFIDNNSPDNAGNRYNLSTYDRIDDEIYSWEDAKSSTQQDSPSAIWEGCYHAIAVANHVLEAIETYEKDGRIKEVSAQKGEALLIRAYNHFTLVNVFSPQYRGEELGKNDQGIPYATDPEKNVIVQYERLSVAEVYSKIEKDLLEGLPLINDAAYEIPKYHFNKKAAYAFAARFYLFKRQYDLVEKYATEALGGTTGSAESYMRTFWGKAFANFDGLVQGYISNGSMNNFMLVPTSSSFMRRYSNKYRYTVNRDAASATFFGPGPTWKGYNFHPCYSGKLYISGAQEYGVFFPKAGELFEYTDKVAGIGYSHVVRCEFTAEETILARAEARLFLNNTAGAIADLKTYDDSRQKNTQLVTLPPLTDQLITSFYGGKGPGFGIVTPLNTDLVCPSDKYSVSEAMDPYLQCVLHFRRIETVFDGYRWFDIKRHGIEVTHKIGKEKVDVLKWDDARRAFQLPAEVISAGMAPTKRTNLPKHGSFIKLDAKAVEINKPTYK